MRLFKNVNQTDLARRLRLHVDRLAGLIGPRHLGAGTSLDAAAAYIERELSACGSVKRQEYQAGSGEVANLVLERTGGKRPDEIVILGAHYDTVVGSPGADDNASAVAVLIEAASLLREAKFSRTVRFVAFTCEEPPHFYQETMGSQVHAAQCRRSSEKITGMLCLEMVGFFKPDRAQQLPPGLPRFLRWLMPRRGNFLAAVGNPPSWQLCWKFWRGFRSAARLRLLPIVLPQRIHEIRLSDNSSFWDQGYKALMITDTSFLRNPNYHTATDTPETLDYASMAQVALGVAGAIARIAGKARRGDSR